MFEIPFVDLQGGPALPVIEVTINGAGPFNALVDTGNATPYMALVSRTVHEKAKLVPTGYEQAGLTVRQGESSQASVSQALGNELTIRGRKWIDARLGIVENREHMAVLTNGAAIDVVLGAAFMAETVVAVDFQRRVIELDTKPLESGGLSFKLNYRQPLLIVDARINQSDNLPMAIDTGSTLTTVWTPVAQGAKLPTSMPTALLSTTAVASELLVNAQRFALDQAVRCNLTVSVSDKVGDLGMATRQIVMGQIGTDILSAGRLVIDYPNQRMWFRVPGKKPDCALASGQTAINYPADQNIPARQ